MKGVDRVGADPSTEKAVEGNDPHRGQGRLCKGDCLLIGVSHGIVEVKLLCFRWLSPFLKLV